MADDAMEHSKETRHLLNNHMQITTIKLDALEKKGEERHTALVEVLDERIGGLRTDAKRTDGALKWAGGLIITIMLSVMAWALTQQLNANESQKKEMAQQIKLLQDQEQARIQARSEILGRLPSASAAEATRAAEGLAQGVDLQRDAARDGAKN